MKRAVCCLLLIACASHQTWRKVELAMGAPVARGTARALAQQPGGAASLDGLLAETPAQLVDLWHTLHLARPIPAVDFSRDVVLGATYLGGVCEPTIDGVRKHANGYVTFDELHHQRVCIMLGLMIVRAVAVPRAVVGEHFTWKHEGRAFAFELGSRATLATHGRETLATHRGEVELPPPGHLALRRLADGYEVWVAHHGSGDIAVIGATYWDGGRFWLTSMIAWDDEMQRFTGGFDSYGRDRDGDIRLSLFEFERASEHTIRIGSVYRLPPRGKRVPGFVLDQRDPPSELPVSTPLVLDGSATPFTRAPIAFAAIPDRSYGVVDLDYVEGRLCPRGKRCAAGPALSDHLREQNATIHGPLVVFRIGDRFPVIAPR